MNRNPPLPSLLPLIPVHSPLSYLLLWGHIMKQNHFLSFSVACLTVCIATHPLTRLSIGWGGGSQPKQALGRRGSNEGINSAHALSLWCKRPLAELHPWAWCCAAGMFDGRESLAQSNSNATQSYNTLTQEGSAIHSCWTCWYTCPCSCLLISAACSCMQSLVVEIEEPQLPLQWFQNLLLFVCLFVSLFVVWVLH